MEKIIWTHRVRNESVKKNKEERNILQIIKKKEDNRIGHIFTAF
jgi:hypothetical protein